MWRAVKGAAEGTWLIGACLTVTLSRTRIPALASGVTLHASAEDKRIELGSGTECAGFCEGEPTRADGVA